MKVYFVRVRFFSAEDVLCENTTSCSCIICSLQENFAFHWESMESEVFLQWTCYMLCVFFYTCLFQGDLSTDYYIYLLMFCSNFNTTIWSVSNELKDNAYNNWWSSFQINEILNMKNVKFKANSQASNVPGN